MFVPIFIPRMKEMQKLVISYPTLHSFQTFSDEVMFFLQIIIKDELILTRCMNRQSYLYTCLLNIHNFIRDRSEIMNMGPSSWVWVRQLFCRKVLFGITYIIFTGSSMEFEQYLHN